MGLDRMVIKNNFWVNKVKELSDTIEEKESYY